MSLRSAIVIVCALAIGLLGTAATGEAQVQILSPTSGAVVHGVVAIKAAKPQSQDGWVTFSVQPSRDAYLAAAMAPFSIKWNTQVYHDGKRVYPDGQYTIKAMGFDGSGRRQGEDSVQITVVNSIDPSEIGGAVELKTRYQKGQLLRYEIEGKMTVNVPGEAGKELREPPKMEMGMDMEMGMPPGYGYGGMMPGEGMMGMPPGYGYGGMMGPEMGMGMVGTGGSQIEGLPSNVVVETSGGWGEEVLSPTATGRAVVDREFLRGYYIVSWLWPKEIWTVGDEEKEEENVPDSYAEVLPAAGDEYRFKVRPSAEVVKMHDEQPDFPLGQTFIELPERPVRVGSSWQGDMTVTMGPTNTEPETYSAIHRLDSFEYKGNFRCARIISKYSARGVEIEIELPQRKEQVGGAGMMGAEGGGMVEPGMGPPGMGMGMGMEGMMAPGMEGMEGEMGMGMGAQVMEYRGNVSIERISYFALEAGRFVAFEDTIDQKINRVVTAKGEVERLSGEKESFEKTDDLYVTQVQPLIAAMVGGGGGMGTMGMMGEEGMMQPGMPGGMPQMGGYGMGMPPGYGYGGMMGEEGMMGMTPMKPPTKATLEITTEWFVYEKTAGISKHAVVSDEAETAGATGWTLPAETYAQKRALGGTGAPSEDGTVFVVDLKTRKFRAVSGSYVPEEHEEIVKTTRNYLLGLGYQPQ